MKIAFAHYHLNRGGVTQVIFNQLKALNDTSKAGQRLKVAVLFGGRCEGWPDSLGNEYSAIDISLHPVSELDYDNVRPHQVDLAEQIHTTLGDAGFGSHETVLHFHNHSLGKNAGLPIAIAALANSGFATLLQIHDFAEDFRPDYYPGATSEITHEQRGAIPGLLYPQASHIHYATLNGRDYSVLNQAGVDESRLHLLPNAVTDLGRLPAKTSSREKLKSHLGVPVTDRLVVYPVRGIRRKNLGEALLWSTLADAKSSFCLTLAPKNPVEQTSYQRWKHLADRLDLKWVFDAGGQGGMDFPETLAASDLILTTSVAEGFGLVFLESWLAERKLVGRNLPAITADFVDAGMQFPELYSVFSIPVDWFDERQLCLDVADTWQKVLASYGRPALNDYDLQDKFSSLVQNELIDFAICPPRFQQQVIERIASDPGSGDRILDVNPAVRRTLQSENCDESLIEHNAAVVRSEYSVERIGARLWNIYQQLAASRRDQALQPLAHEQRILDSFLDISRFYPLRVLP